MGFPTPPNHPLGAGLPPPIAALLEEIISAISENFQTYPPHTIQRLAELVLKPKQHYRNLPSYLHALDRVVHVTSAANVYPLPPAIPEATAMSRLANGLGGGGIHSGLSINSAAAANIGSDEALGGALLTPIPWLTRQANGDDGSSDVESSSPISAGTNPVRAAHPSQQGQPVQQARQGAGSTAGGSSSSSSNSSSSSGGDRQMATESTETIEGPNGMGRIETVSVSITNGMPTLSTVNRGITQGELLRQEQRAGVVPVSQLARHGHVGAGGQGPSSGTRSGQAQGHAAPNGGPSDAEPSDEDATMNDEDPEQEVPHVRGPEEIGAADMGPQNPNSTFHQAAGASLEMQVIDVEAAVGRPGEGSHKSPEPTSADDTQSLAEATASSRSPKREAGEELEPSASKRVKDDAGAGETSGAEPTQEPKRDAEGDVVIADPTSESKTTADGPDGQDDAGNKESS